MTGVGAGPAGFDYTVTVDGHTSNVASASINYLPQVEFITVWQTDNAGTSASNQITLPLVNNGSYNFTVDWGDGTQDTITAWDAAAKTRAYPGPGKYTVKMSGVFTHFAFNNSGDKNKILDVLNWGENKWSSMASAFYGCSKLKMSATDAPDLSNVTNMSYMFSGATVFNGQLL